MKFLSTFKRTKLASVAALALVSTQGLADIQSQNAARTLAQNALSVNGNAAAGRLTIDRKDPHAFTGGSITLGGTLEYGNVDEIFELFNDLSDEFKPGTGDGNNGGGNNGGGNNGGGTPDIDWDKIFEEYPDLEGRLKALEDEVLSTAALFTVIAAEGYAKAEADLEMSFVIQDDLWGGTLLLGNHLKGYSKAVGIFEDVEFDENRVVDVLEQIVELGPDDPIQEYDLSGGLVLFYDPANIRARLQVNNDSLMLVKTAIINKLNLTYSREALANDNGSLYWGVKPTYYSVGLSNVGVSIGDITDSEKIFDDIRNADYTYSSGVDFDLGVMWASDTYQLGAALNNVVESKYKFPEIDRTRFKSTQIVKELEYHENYVMERQLKLEGAIYTKDRDWSLNVNLDANKIRDPMKNEYQWATISGAYASESWWLPSARLGLSKNLVGSKLSYLNAGITMLKVINLDVATTLDTVRLDDKKLMRGLTMSLGVQFEY